MTTPNLNPPTRDKFEKRFRLVAFMRIEPEDDEPMTYDEALAEKEQLELMSPENIYRIEEEQNACASPSK